MGDPIFDQFFASTVPSLDSDATTAQKVKDGGVKLLDQIGVSPIICILMDMDFIFR